MHYFFRLDVEAFKKCPSESIDYALMEKTFDWKKSHFKRCNMEAMKHSFASDHIKEKIQSTIEAAYQ